MPAEYMCLFTLILSVAVVIWRALGPRKPRRNDTVWHEIADAEQEARRDMLKRMAGQR